MGGRRIILQVNGLEHEVEIKPGRSLLDLLREKLGLTGSKNGCGKGHCGACTVILDGRAIRSCVYPVERAVGKRVETIEGLATDGKLHPLQRAFGQEGGVQCGFCTPGMIMAAKALLDRNPDPTEAEIRRALRHNLCRCTGYARIIRAVQAAAAELRGEALVSMIPPAPSSEHSLGGFSVRPDARPKVTGAAKYAADLDFPGMLHAKVLRSHYPHARLVRVDTEAARVLPGVVAVLTAQDVPGLNRHGLARPDWPVLCDERVRYVGDAIAVVVAESPDIAEEALDQIEVIYDPLPVLDTPEKALAPDAITLHEDGNVAEQIQVSRGDVAQGFAQADVVISRTYHTARAEHAFLEPETSVARLDGDQIVVYVGSQIPFEDQRQIAAALDLPVAQVRVVHTETGGTFGGKEDIAGQIHAALATWVTRRPVKLTYSRSESFISHPKRHPTRIQLKTGVTCKGKLVALQAQIIGDTGAYASLGPYVMTRTATHATGPYEIPNVDVDCRAVYTNNIPSGAFRGFGVPQSAFAIETQMDLMAERIGISPWEIRRRNAYREGSVTGTGQVLRDVGLIETLDRVAEAWKERGSDAATRDKGDNKRYGWGVACAYKNVGLGGGAPDQAGASVEITADNGVLVKAGAAEVGQGLVAVLAQIVVEELGVSPQRVQVLVGDTDLTLDGGATTASRQTFVTGNAVRLAAVALRERLAGVAAAALGVKPAEVIFCEDRVEVVGDPESGLAFGQVLDLARDQRLSLYSDHVYHAPATRPLGEGGDMHFAFGYATQLAEVEVDVETGQVTVLCIIAAHDVGRAINPLGVIGQIEGGVVMGMGLGLKEELPMAEGQPLITDFSGYHIPNSEELPDIRAIIVQKPASEGPYGAKGIGEIPSIPTAAAITNAIYQACGVRLYRIPATPERVLEALAAHDPDIYR